MVLYKRNPTKGTEIMKVFRKNIFHKHGEKYKNSLKRHKNYGCPWKLLQWKLRLFKNNRNIRGWGTKSLKNSENIQKNASVKIHQNAIKRVNVLENYSNENSSFLSSIYRIILDWESKPLKTFQKLLKVSEEKLQ